ncbi:MAG: N,N'-diacetyllegionaminic acid synthase [Syntrophorhabdus sp. PtaU1.Bin050]|nr:MAG: N,N'-diacetyllegionaminic acid synthase [Syntrophorhabdus sp. PtaU1.Bin050]
MTESFWIGKKEFGRQHRLVIAEVAQGHDGSLGTAHAFIDAVAKTGADAIKFQTHIASAESTPRERWRTQFSLQDETRYDYWKRMEFTEEQWHGLKTHANEKGLLFLSSPFSVEAVELLKRIDVPAWKIASGEVTNSLLFEEVLSTKLPILLSTGVSDIAEIDQIVANIQKHDVPLLVFQCTTAYPCPPESIGVNLVPFFQQRYGCPVGLSDHSGSIYAGLSAVTLGAEAIEVHVTLSREMFGPDVSASLTTSKLQELVDGVRFIEKMINQPVRKDSVTPEIKTLRNLFTKSIVARKRLLAGTILKKEHITLKKPGDGLSPTFISEVIGKRLICDLAQDQQLALEMLEKEKK